MKALILAGALLLAGLSAQAQDTTRTAAPRRQAVSLQNYGVTTVSAQPVATTADVEPHLRTTKVIATGENAPLPAGYTRHKTVGGHSYISGPKGGCFYVDAATGKRVYVDHRFCQ